ncbi:hypothetical protein [Nonomuraea sp. SYSU D8015]|uniref:hypothetical protein n=1 Tax=Nonomuraea sp. SYSU D8015 TaxID=2593644 RepID=UPI001CB6CEAC|nr:hypothetical protein [Nonomuraea sp. SYSU D8015]
MNVFDLFRGSPPGEYSPAAIWWWSGEPLRRDRLRWQLSRLVDGGVRNLVILNLAPSGPMFGADADDPPFLSEAWWELLDGVCADAYELGAHLWFYDQLGFSGADLQARLVQERPEFAGQWLAADGSVTLRGFDYLSPEACAVLLDRVHGEFERRVGHWFGRVIAGSFQDELPTLPTWSSHFAAEYLARRGRPFSLEDPDWQAYQRTRAELAEEAFFRPLAEWHARHGLLSGCDQQDPARAGHPVDGVRLYADYARTHRWFGAPGSDHHGDARLHSSLAHLYGRPRTWIEAFHSSGWGGTLEETFDWLLPWLRAGATLYNPHAVYYTTKRGWWEWAPPSTDWRQPYWRHHRVFADAVARLCAALSLGRHACDVAVLLPIATAQTGTPPPATPPLPESPPSGGTGLPSHGTAVGPAGAAPDDTASRGGASADSVPVSAVSGSVVSGSPAPGDPAPGGAGPVGPGEVGPGEVGPGGGGPGGGAWGASGDSAPSDPVSSDPALYGSDGSAPAGSGVAPLGPLVQAAASDGALVDGAASGGGGPEGAGAGSGGAGTGCGGSGGVGEWARRAQEVYRQVVGDMAWFDTRPGALDRLALDADVIDEDSVRRAVVEDGRLTVSTEAYRAIILPAVTVLDADVAARLREFAAAGGRLVAVGALPDALGGLARYVESPDGLGEALADLPRRVEAPVPALVREAGDTTLVFLTATFPMASRIGVGRPEERGVELGWLDADIDFDPARYAPDMRVVVRGVRGTPLLARPFAGGEPVALPHTRDGDAVEVVVPFDDGPAALLVFDGSEREPAPPRPAYPVEVDLGDEWDVELVPTLDDTWSDFGGGGAVERWTLRTPDGAPVAVTFGPRGEQRVGDAPWTPSVWSASRGLRKDPIHRETLGPKGHVPAEFLAFGRVRAGAEARFRTVLTAPPGGGWLAIGAAAAKTLWLDGVELQLDDAGYAAVARQPVTPGEHLLELLLVPDEELDLRAYVCLVADPADAARPEWIAGTPLETVVGADQGESLLQVASTAFCRVLVNGVEAGRQGGFDPYAEADIPRVRRYDVSHLLRPGDNTIRIESDGWVLVDGLAVSGPGWSPRPRVRRRQHGDPAALCLRPRPHPLPEAGWLDGRPAALPATFAVPGARPRVERFLLEPPPGMTGLDVDAAGPVKAVPAEGGSLELRVTTVPGAQAGAAFTGPVRFTCGPGRMRLGDWEEHGLAGYSGGVRYRTTVTACAGPGVVDLGRVRGTAEVTVNGRPCGVRVCSPYVFDVELDDGDNTVEVLVLGTLGPYLDEVSPTHFVFPGQRRTGLSGPVRLRRGAQPRPVA